LKDVINETEKNNENLLSVLFGTFEKDKVQELRQILDGLGVLKSQECGLKARFNQIEVN
jgi:hypothetical protein